MFRNLEPLSSATKSISNSDFAYLADQTHFLWRERYTAVTSIQSVTMIGAKSEVHKSHAR